jgi:predicted peptidase
MGLRPVGQNYRSCCGPAELLPDHVPNITARDARRFPEAWGFLHRIILASFALLVPVAASAGSGDLYGFVAGTYRDSEGNTMPYRLYSPVMSAPSVRYPLVLFLHGLEGVGKDNEKQISGMDFAGAHAWVMPHNQAAHPCFVLAPQCPPGGLWINPLTRKPSKHLRCTVALIEELSSELPIDQRRIYVTGQSMGGYGAWAAISFFPDFFAAAVPVCGGGRTGRARFLVGTPVWAFHGSLDPVIWPRESRRMISALRKAGGNPRYTEFRFVGHKAWTAAYSHPELVPWLFAQTRAPRP